MLKHKTAHGSGSDLTFPDVDEIKANMEDHSPDYKVNIYGDGSYTTPTLWWAALGGFGVWMPDWPNPSLTGNGDTLGHHNQSEQDGRQVLQPGTDQHRAPAMPTGITQQCGHSGEGTTILRIEGMPCSLSCIAGDVSLLSFGAAIRRIPSFIPSRRRT